MIMFDLKSLACIIEFVKEDNQTKMVLELSHDVKVKVSVFNIYIARFLSSSSSSKL